MSRPIAQKVVAALFLAAVGVVWGHTAASMIAGYYNAAFDYYERYMTAEWTVVGGVVGFMCVIADRRLWLACALAPICHLFVHTVYILVLELAERPAGEALHWWITRFFPGWGAFLPTYFPTSSLLPAVAVLAGLLPVAFWLRRRIAELEDAVALSTQEPGRDPDGTWNL